jgi:signal transduction histidine kinase/DNA-binding NarL/FixJ family response regulator
MKSLVPVPQEQDGLRQAVDAALLDMAFGRLRLSVLLTAFVCVLFVVLFWSFFPSDHKIVWVSVMLAISALRFGLWWAHARAAEPARRHRVWRTLFFVGAVAAGASWAYGPVMLMPVAGDNTSMLLVLAVLAVSAVSMSAMGAQLGAMLSFQATALVPSILALAATDGSVERMAAAVMLAGMVSLMIVGRASHESTRALIETELRLSRAVAETSAARERAESASQAKTRFLANMSHELRSPLNAVIGAAQLMKAGEADRERQDHLIEAIGRSGTNLLGLIENILDLSRIEAGEMTLERQDFHLFDCIDAALATTGLAARAKGLQLACIADPDLPAWRHGDAARLRQVLLNLLGNAVKFTQHGEIVVRVEPGPDPQDVCISIRDTGVGIGAQAIAHVFEPFRQADDSAGRRFGGSGLGLAIVRQLMLAMGGEVSVQSQLGQGSTFKLLLPLPLASPDDTVEPTGKHLRVAYFEPHQASADALQALLRRMGCESRCCRDAQDVRKWYAENAGSMEDAWLLVCTDVSQTTELLEQTLDLVEPERVIGMSSQESIEAELARERFHLPRNVIKPVSRSSLASRFVSSAERARRSRVDELPVPANGNAQADATAHILVVEDDALNRVIVTRMLQHAGHGVTAVADGASALAILRRQSFALVLMDWQMPDMDGLEATRRIRAGEAGEGPRALPIIALTANAFAEDREACLAAGMNDFLTKPVLAGILHETITRWIAPQAVNAELRLSPARRNAPDSAAAQPGTTP